ncbi:MarR family winged helix-turn-helix transcriptional regulator [Microbacterium immunditiarum]|uniref:DNA-binding MarR family transcriptional regulator n=1 Tax=Microbacterium immunditiarum TaxID=337480 RepID=A0A7Y9KKF2_9MICO|nr:MarR family winged helix-turn-helix transcriptional regulator [Microbacterium immunditiarum]NYE20691.1 DNA-binding MarR family transcriptional regulator [Microbacterium immunditiarum]
MAVTDPPHPPLTQDFGWALGVLLRAYRDRVAPILSDFPQTTRGYETLAEVVVNGQRPSQLALAQRLGIDRTVMTYLVDDLEDAGLLARRPNPEDRRQRRIVATKQGEEVIGELCTLVAGAERDALAALDPDERAEFHRLLLKAAAGAAADDSPAGSPAQAEPPATA